MAPTYDLQMKAVAAIVGSYHWRKVTIIYEDNNYGAAGSITNLIDALQEVNAEVDQQSAFPPFASLSDPQNSIIKQLEALKNKPGRVFIVHASVAFSSRLFIEAQHLGMMESDYVWITTDRVTKNLDSINSTVISSMQGVVGVRGYFSHTGTRYRNFYARFRQRFRSRYPEEDILEPDIFGTRAYDAVWVVAKAMESLQSGFNAENNANVSSEGPHLLQGILSSNFKGLSSEIQFLDGQLVPVPLVFQIVNVIGRSYRELGFWSQEFNFSRGIHARENGTQENSKSMNILGRVLWPGDPGFVPRGWSPASSERPLLIAVPADSAYDRIMRVKYNETTHEPSFGGFSIEVFRMVTEQLPYHLSYRFIPYHGPYDTMVREVGLGHFDAVVGDTAIVANRCRFVEFSHPYSESGVTMVVLEQPVDGSALIFLKPLTTTMWALSGAVILYNGLIVWLIEREDDENLHGSFFDQFGKLVWLSFATLFSIHGGTLRSNLSRMAMVVWLFVALVLTSSYTASFSSMLTVRRLRPSFADVETLKKTNAIVGCDRMAFVERYLVEVLHFDPKRIKTFSSGVDYPKALESGEIKAAFLEVPYAKWLLSKNCKGFTMAGPTHEIGGFGYVFRRGSPYIADVSEKIIKLRESGEISKLETDLVLSSNCTKSEKEDETGSLGPDGFWGLFVITGGTSTLALLLFLIGRVRENWDRNNNPQPGLVDLRELPSASAKTQNQNSVELAEITRDQESLRGSLHPHDEIRRFKLVVQRDDVHVFVEKCK